MTRRGSNARMSPEVIDVPRRLSQEGRKPRSNPVGTLWVCAAVWGVLCAVLALAELPDGVEHGNGENRSAATASSWIAGLPAGARVLVVLPGSDITATTVESTIAYMTYPRRYIRALDRIPAEGSTRFDAVIALAAARRTVPPTWRIAAQAYQGSYQIALATPPAAAAVQSSVPLAPVRRFPLALGIVGALVSSAAVFALGAMLLTSTLQKAPFASRPANLAAAHLVGAAAITWVEMTLIATTGRVSSIPVYVVIAGLIPMWRSRRKWSVFGARDHAADAPDDTSKRGRLMARAGILIALLAVAMYAIMWGIGGDAHRIWQFKAKAFWIDGSAAMLRDSAHLSNAYLDYPLLVPIQTWWAYIHFGAPADGLAQIASLLFFVDILILFAAYAGRHVATAYRRLGVILLLSPTVVLWYAAAGWADIPFAAYFLATAAALTMMAEESDPSYGYLAAWLAAGLLLTKNEGVPAVLAMAALTGWSAWRRGDRSAFRSAARLLGASAVAYLPWFAIKQMWNLRTDLFDRSRYAAPAYSLGMLAYRFWFSITHGFLAQILCIGPRYPGWGLVGLILVVGLACRLFRRQAPGAALWGFAGLQLAGYVGIYIITPMPFEWHVHFSAERLALQVFPVLLLGSLTACFGTRAGAPAATVVDDDLEGATARPNVAAGGSGAGGGRNGRKRPRSSEPR